MTSVSVLPVDPYSISSMLCFHLYGGWGGTVPAADDASSEAGVSD